MEPVLAAQPDLGIMRMFQRCEDGRRTDEANYRGAAGGIFGRLLDFLNRLDAAHINYKLNHTRPDSVMTEVSMPGSRWEVEFMADGSVDIERYRSVAGVENDPALLELIFSDTASG